MIEDPIEARRRAFLAQVASDQRAANDKFWRLHHEVERIEEEFNTTPWPDDEGEDAVLREYSKGSVAAINAALLCGVFSAAAVHAKLKLTHWDPEAWELPGFAENAARMIEWDLERCAKVEWVARG